MNTIHTIVIDWQYQISKTGNAKRKFIVKCTDQYPDASARITIVKALKLGMKAMNLKTTIC